MAEREDAFRLVRVFKWSASTGSRGHELPTLARLIYGVKAREMSSACDLDVSGRVIPLTCLSCFLYQFPTTHKSRTKYD